MKTLVKHQISIYLFNDDMNLDISDERIVVGDPVEFIISDCNALNTSLYEQVTAPADWRGHKYLFDGQQWTPNPLYDEPAQT